MMVINISDRIVPVGRVLFARCICGYDDNFEYPGCPASERGSAVPRRSTGNVHVQVEVPTRDRESRAHRCGCRAVTFFNAFFSTFYVRRGRFAYAVEQCHVCVCTGRSSNALCRSTVVGTRSWKTTADRRETTNAIIFLNVSDPANEIWTRKNTGRLRIVRAKPEAYNFALAERYVRRKQL